MIVRAIGIAAALAGAVPAAAAGYQTIYDFDDLPVGTTSLMLGMNPVNKGSGGTIATSGSAHSGSQVYQGTVLDFVVDDEINYDWPAIGGWVSGADTVTLTAWNYNPDTRNEDLVGTATAGAGSHDVFLAVGSDMNPVQLTKWQFASTSPFTLDDLTRRPGQHAGRRPGAGGVGADGRGLRRGRGVAARA